LVKIQVLVKEEKLLPKEEEDFTQIFQTIFGHSFKNKEIAGEVEKRKGV